MTQEVRITVDADYYCRPGDLTFSEEHLKTWVGGMIKAIFEMDEKVTPFPRGFRPKHRFVNVNIDVIPHDNDRDYTEEDAEKHLNGEPEKKRKTYAEDFFEKFPNADRTSGSPSVCRDSVYGIAKDCAGRLCGDCWQTAMPDESEDADA